MRSWPTWQWLDGLIVGCSLLALAAAGDALDELRRCAGTQFDPRVVAAFATVAGRAADRVAATAP